LTIANSDAFLSDKNTWAKAGFISNNVAISKVDKRSKTRQFTTPTWAVVLVLYRCMQRIEKYDR
jgi:hypothetical protein